MDSDPYHHTLQVFRTRGDCHRVAEKMWQRPTAVVSIKFLHIVNVLILRLEDTLADSMDITEAETRTHGRAVLIYPKKFSTPRNVTMACPVLGTTETHAAEACQRQKKVFLELAGLGGEQCSLNAFSCTFKWLHDTRPGSSCKYRGNPPGVSVLMVQDAWLEYEGHSY
ncbi:hypothetical protein B0F90DRAFT_209932 [Multifurca ochricompacta]|uniref:Uncharacterized protein n=1 Tax=Multifurca ochricompacta TaxID=376703 RepID=A0AAD4M5J7_9AGAM|nr:hypothetical protein B0F90DRAFT_209932 [Multifurca ochricompacta]